MSEIEWKGDVADFLRDWEKQQPKRYVDRFSFIFGLITALAIFGFSFGLGFIFDWLVMSTFFDVVLVTVVTFNVAMVFGFKLQRRFPELIKFFIDSQKKFSGG